MKFGIVSRTEDGLFRYQAWPTVCRDEDGVLYVGASSHRMGHICPFGKNHMYISRDGGETWSLPTVINDTVMDDRDAGMTYLGDGKLMLTYFHQPMSLYFDNPSWLAESAGDLKKEIVAATIEAWRKLPQEDTKGSFIRLSTDKGKSWGPAIQVPVSSPHGPMLLKNGKLFFIGKEFYSGEDLDEGAIYAYESADEGKTWTMLSKIDFPDGCDKENIHEPHAVELEDGTLVGMLRGQGKEVNYGFSMFSTFSYDGGKSWTHPAALDICGSPPHLLLHSSGALVLTYGRRHNPHFGQRARISYDGGQTWGEELVISQDAEIADLGYPSSVELDDGSIFTVYYQRVDGDNFCSILYTKWELPERT